MISSQLLYFSYLDDRVHLIGGMYGVIDSVKRAGLGNQYGYKDA